VIGTYNSGCAEAMIPILGKAPNGGLAMVSPGNTPICLTQSSPSCGKGEPGSLYRARRNDARVVPNDAYQGAGLASFARTQEVSRAFVLYAANDPTSLGQAKTFRGTARKLGIEVAGFRSWNPPSSALTPARSSCWRRTASPSNRRSTSPARPRRACSSASPASCRRT
jgi:ABC-type branched-subunit amino acid transport system substrate-binding protein